MNLQTNRPKKGCPVRRFLWTTRGILQLTFFPEDRVLVTSVLVGHVAWRDFSRCKVCCTLGHTATYFFQARLLEIFHSRR